MRVALTGGIGAGKSYVSRALARRGIEVYDCDAAAKRLMSSSADMQRELSQLVGEEVFADGKLRKQLLAQFITANENNVRAVNDIVHPAVAADFEQSGMQWLESAIFFDSGFDKRVSVDCVVCVAAPEEVRIARVMQRDGISREKAMAWIRRQLPQDMVVSQSTYVIVNDGILDIEEQIDKTINQIKINERQSP